MHMVELAAFHSAFEISPFKVTPPICVELDCAKRPTLLCFSESALAEHSDCALHLMTHKSVQAIPVYGWSLLL